jgi:hypothetical protein
MHEKNEAYDEVFEVVESAASLIDIQMLTHGHHEVYSINLPAVLVSLLTPLVCT